MRSPRRIKFHATLRSDIENAWFRAKLLVEWTRLADDQNHEIAYLEAAIRNHISGEAGKITCQWSLLQADAAQDALNVDLRGLEHAVIHPAIRVDFIRARLRASRRMARAIRKEQTRQLPYAISKRTIQLAEITSLRVLRDEILARPDLALVWWLRNRCAGSSSLTEKDFKDAIESIKSMLTEPARPLEPAATIQEVLHRIDRDKQITFFHHMGTVLEMIDQSAAAEHLTAALAEYDIPKQPSVVLTTQSPRQPTHSL